MAVLQCIRRCVQFQDTSIISLFVGEDWDNSEELWPVHTFFKQRLHDKHVDLVAGGFSYLRQQLDSADTMLWQEEEFGKGRSNNMERMMATCCLRSPLQADILLANTDLEGNAFGLIEIC